MTTEQAIEISSGILGIWPQHPTNEHREATKLGIEALKRERMRRGAFNPIYSKLLPGETKE